MNWLKLLTMYNKYHMDLRFSLQPDYLTELLCSSCIFCLQSTISKQQGCGNNMPNLSH